MRQSEGHVENSEVQIQRKRPGISVFVICQNEIRVIRRCLQSVSWCDEIVVVDGGSTDGTIEACKEFTDKVVHHPWPGYVEQKRFALNLCTQEWVLNLDSDEEISPELRREIEETLSYNSVNEPEVNGYSFSRIVFYLDRWWRRGGWYPEYRLRLCRRSSTAWGGTDPHEHAIVTGKTRRLEGELRHYTYTSLEDHTTRLISHASTAAHNLFEKGYRSTLFQITVNPIVRFLKFFIVKKGFLEGAPGFIVGCLEAYYVFLKYVKLWELGQAETRTVRPKVVSYE